MPGLRPALFNLSAFGNPDLSLLVVFGWRVCATHSSHTNTPLTQSSHTHTTLTQSSQPISLRQTWPGPTSGVWLPWRMNLKLSGWLLTPGSGLEPLPCLQCGPQKRPEGTPLCLCTWYLHPTPPAPQPFSSLLVPSPPTDKASFPNPNLLTAVNPLFALLLLSCTSLWRSLVLGTALCVLL